MKRFIYLFLAVLIALPMVIPVGAASNKEVPVVGILYDSEFRSAMNSKFSVLSDPTEGVTTFLLWKMMDKVVASIGYGGFTSYSDLSKACSAVNQYFSSAGLWIWNDFDNASAAYLQVAIGSVFKPLSWEIRENSQYGYVIVEKQTGLTLCNSLGAFPYYKTTLPNDDDIESPTLGGQWVREDRIPDPTLYNVVNEATLYDIGQALKDTGRESNQNVVVQYREKYQAIRTKTHTRGYHYYYCDCQSRPYVYRPASDQWAQEKDNNYYVEDDDDDVYDDGPTENNQMIDVDNNTVWFPDGTLNYIENLYYDESTKTYYVDARQEYNFENNTYITNNYHYEYHINYTSITYIGTSEEYNKNYECYFELPDGRSSADLTAEELLALNLNIDVVPYIRSSDNTALRSLYHFDGNTFDSSYWSYATEFKWLSGASITYLESGNFGGALYLDEGTHSFQVSVPNNISDGDFTLQWRMYSSKTLAPVTDGFVFNGNVPLFFFSGAYMAGSEGSGFNPVGDYPVPVGNWYEVALIRESGVLRLYLNGLQIVSSSFDVPLGKDFRFSFGSGQQTYKQIDELRLLNYPLVRGGASYTPTAVPHDTNLSLVLPDSTVPIADEYWSFDKTIEPLYSFDLTTGVNDYSSLLKSRTMSVKTSFPTWPEWGYNASKYTNLSFTSGYASLSHNYSGVFDTMDNFDGGLDTRVGWFRDSDSYQYNLPIGDYTLSILDANGELFSFPFSVPERWALGPITNGWGPHKDFSWGRVGFYLPGTTSAYGNSVLLMVLPNQGVNLNIAYMEIVPGLTPNTGHEWVTGIVPVQSDFKTPTLAVRTSHKITSHQIGGVRPSLPTKGLVWALVENGRITSLQIYNGQAWEAVDGRIWTGARWVPYYAYNVILLKDMYDVIEADPSQEYIYTEQGFWAWMQRAWAQMMAKLEQIRLAITGGSGIPGDSSNPAFPGEEDNPETEDDEGWSFIDLLGAVKDGVWSMTTGVVGTAYGGVTSFISGVVSVGNFFDAYSPDSSENIFGIMQYGGSDIWD